MRYLEGYRDMGVTGGQYIPSTTGTPELYHYRYYRELEQCPPAEQLKRLEGMVMAVQAALTLPSARQIPHVGAATRMMAEGLATIRQRYALIPQAYNIVVR